MANELAIDMCVELRRYVLPAIFSSSTAINDYGKSDSSSDALNQYMSYVESRPVGALAAKIEEIIVGLTEADPRKLSKRATWLDRILGRDVELHVRYVVAKQDLDLLIEDSVVVAQRVRDSLVQLNALLKNHASECLRLDIFIRAGREYLTENPVAGLSDTEAVDFEKPRERFARRLANLATLRASHEMSVLQLKTAQASALDMLDRFEETTSVLVPVWRQHALALATTSDAGTSLIANATSAHDQLLKSLSESLQKIDS